jgi:hypothetical protein
MEAEDDDQYAYVLFIMRTQKNLVKLMNLALNYEKETILLKNISYKRQPTRGRVLAKVHPIKIESFNTL